MSATRHAGAERVPRLDAERARQLRFILAGLWNTLFGYLAFLLAFALIGSRHGELPSLVLGYLLALPQAYLVQRTLVFRAGGDWPSQFARFALTNTVVFACNLVALPLAVRVLGADPRIAQGVFIAIATVATYFAHKHYSFRQT